MSLFSRPHFTAEPSFANLFRLLDDFDNYSREGQNSSTTKGEGHQSRPQFFNPKFDVRETDTSYELDGELPGIAKENVHIEFADPHTLVIRGKIERTYTSGNPPAGAIEASQPKGAVTDGTEGDKSAEEQPGSTEKSAEVVKKDQAAAPAERFWRQERSIGEFQRHFTFPTSVDQSAVKANLKDGVLHLTIPKAKKPENRRIDIN